MKRLLLLALLLPLMAHAADVGDAANRAEALKRIGLARQAIALNPPKDALLDSPLAAHPMFGQVFASLDQSKLNEAAAMLMAETFTSDELQALVNFQDSPEGKQIRLKMPAYQKILGATLQNYLSVAFQQMVARQQNGASSLPVAVGASPSLPPMQVPPAAEPVVNAPGTPLKPGK